MILLKCIGVTVSHNMLPSSSHHGRTVKQSQNKLRNALCQSKNTITQNGQFPAFFWKKFSRVSLFLFMCRSLIRSHKSEKHLYEHFRRYLDHEKQNYQRKAREKKYAYFKRKSFKPKRQQQS